MMQNNKTLKSWEINSENWIESIDNNKIESRKLITNQAIIEVIKKYSPQNVLDLGCGEGWLTRELENININTIGIDGTKKLIENARQKGGTFFQISYESIINGYKIPEEPFEGIVINFALFDETETMDLLKTIYNKITDNGSIFIQTLHPYNLINNEKPYKSRWENNSWVGLEGNYSDPHEWYNRTLEEWINLFLSVSYKIAEIKEPVNPKTMKPQSIIFVLAK